MNAGGPPSRRIGSWNLSLCAAAALLLIAAGCGGGEQVTEPPADEGVVEEPASPEAAQEPAPVAEGGIQEESLQPDRGDPGRATASARIEPRSGSSLSGAAGFEQTADGVRVVVKVSGAKPGDHGVHIHEIGDCSADDASSAGGHFNPAGVAHGAPGAAEHHPGDFGNITIAADGSGTLELITQGVTLGDGASAIVGRAIVVHADPDDLSSQPSGNAGARIGCGLIR
ncbi:MAG: superoxide dismutase family protein [Deltaproteobacteria bacterium]|nr:superoxide dismutase family protein [Deltaproteobacteria bacterium]